MRKALIVGINNYPNAPLYGCVNDAKEVARVLQRNGNGTPNFDVRLLAEDNLQISRSKFREAVNNLFEGQSEIALLYFSGHGTVTSTGGYIVTSDFTRYDEGVSMDEILTLANQSSAKDKIIILDCCHSGAFGSPTVNGALSTQINEGVTILTACRNSEYAVEQDGAGVFTTLLIDALEGGASDLRGYISPGGLYAYIDEALGAWDQRPVFKTNVSRFTPIRRVNPPISLDILRNLCVYFMDPNQEYKLDPSYEDTEESADPTKVLIFKELQKLTSVGLVKPVGEEHMYYAALHSKGCKLTALGYQYWRLAKENKI